MAASDIKAKLTSAGLIDKRGGKFRQLFQFGHGAKKDAIINLTNKAIVTSGVDMVVPVTGVYVDTISITVANGVVVGAVLS